MYTCFPSVLIHPPICLRPQVITEPRAGLPALHGNSPIVIYASLSCTGEGNGNPRQYSCLENPRDGGASWAAVYGVAESRTRLKRLSSSSSSSVYMSMLLSPFISLSPSPPVYTSPKVPFLQSVFSQGRPMYFPSYDSEHLRT